MKTKLSILVTLIAVPLLIAQTPIKFTYFVKLNTDAAVPVAFTNTVIKATRITLIGMKDVRTTNSAPVWVGMTSGNNTQPIKVQAGESVSFNLPDNRAIDLSSLYLDVENTTDGILVVYE